MLSKEHTDVRTTVTLDDDVATKLDREARASGRSFKAVLNETLRLAFVLRQEAGEVPRFRVEARELGLYPGLDYSDVGALLEVAEGADHR
jgi:hypothetical protein